MSAFAPERRGQPLLFLALLLASWVLVRVATWESPWPIEEDFPDAVRFAALGPMTAGTHSLDSKEAHPPLAHPHPVRDTRTFTSDGPLSSDGLPDRAALTTNDRPMTSGPSSTARVASPPMSSSVAQWLERDTQSGKDSPAIGASEAKAEPLDRWRFDGWLFLRNGSIRGLGTGARPVSYGASQAGGILSYRFDRNAAAYARGSRALADGGETEAAIGFRAQPLAGLPLAGHVEARVTQRESGVEVRPAAFVAGGFERQRLPAGLQGRGYAQAGYVGGDFATGFVDGAAQVEREIAHFGSGEIHAGAGAWGGAQTGAARLDIGPTMRLDLEIADTPMRLSADYRLRVAGNAEPASGMAITLSAGF